MREIDTIVVHCADHRTARFEEVLKWHTNPNPQGNGWDDIGYHLFIEQDGDEWDGRPLQIQGAHVSGHNKNTIGVCLQGLDKFTFVQLETLRMDVYAYEVMLGKTLKIKAHYEYDTAQEQGKTCPNINADLLREFIREEKYLRRVEIYKKMEV